MLHDPDYGMNLNIIEIVGLSRLSTIPEKVLEETVNLNGLMKRADKNRGNRDNKAAKYSEQKQKEESYTSEWTGCQNCTMDKLAVSIGKRKVGNTSPDIQTAIKDMAHYFYKKDELSVQCYKAILSKV